MLEAPSPASASSREPAGRPARLEFVFARADTAARSWPSRPARDETRRSPVRPGSEHAAARGHIAAPATAFVAGCDEQLQRAFADKSGADVNRALVRFR